MEALSAGGHPAADARTGAVRPSRARRAEPQTDFERVWLKLARSRKPAEAVGPMEASARLAQLAGARRFLASLQAEREQRRQVVLEQVRAQLDEIDAAYADELRAAEESSASARPRRVRPC